MPTLRIDNFRGLAPRFDRRRLPPGAAQVAINMRFDGGDLMPLRGLANPMLAPLGETNANIGSLHVFDRQGMTNPLLIPFGSNFRVTSTRGPVPDDQFSRWYWCVAGEGLRAISLANPSIPTPNGNQTGAGSNYRPFVGYRAGIPAPKVAPVATATDSGIGEVGWSTGVAITSIANTNPIRINTSAEPPFSNGDRVRLTVNPNHPKPDQTDGGLPPEDPVPGSVVGQIWGLNGLTGVVSNKGPNGFDVVGVSATQFQSFVTSDRQNLQVRRELVDSDLESRAYVFTYVSQFDEEGPPSPPSNIVDVIKDGGVEIAVSDLAFASADGGTRDFVNRIRVYRTVAGESGAQFLFVGTLNYSGGGSPDSALEWVNVPSAPFPASPWSGKLFDGVPAVSLGDPIVSSEYYPPPNDLQGIAMMPNGIMAGWSGNTVQFCEPFLPHAWPPDYKLTFPDDVVGCESFGNSLVVGTRGRPFVVSGVDSASMVSKRMDHHAPLLGPGLIADAGSGVIYCSDIGLIWVGPDGSRVLTPQFKKENWVGFVGGRTELLWFDQYALLHGPVQPASMFTVFGDQAEASNLSVDFSCGVRRRNSLVVVVRRNEGSIQPYRSVRLFNERAGSSGEAIRLTGVYRSGLLATRRPANYAVGQVFADDYPVNLKIRVVWPNSYNNPVVGQPDLSALTEQDYIVEGPEPFRLGSGAMSREIEIEVESQHRVQSVVLSTSFDELRAESG